MPLKVPFKALKLAQTGLFWMLNFSVRGLASDVVGVKL